jgi:hypothetical protein
VADRIFPHETFELYFVKHNPQQSWHWISRQTPSEVIIMLMFDTKAGGARCRLPLHPLHCKDKYAKSSSLCTRLIQQSIGGPKRTAEAKRRDQVGHRYQRIKFIARLSILLLWLCGAMMTHVNACSESHNDLVMKRGCISTFPP